MLVIVAGCLSVLTMHAQDYYVGGDISLLQRYNDYNVPYYDQQGKSINDVLAYMKSDAVGWNAQRVRLFVNPTPSIDDNDPAICQDLDYVIRLGKRIKDAGFAFMLDFHYSDSWADPSKQWTPVAWQSLNDAQLQTQIYDYTKTCLQKLVEAGATPNFIQTGNEISYGMLWGAKGSQDNRCYTSSSANWSRFIALLNQATKACREVCPKAKIIIHTERTGEPETTKAIYQKLAGVDYDVIGLSYYPFWHKSLTVLATTLTQLATAFPDKKVQIVETAYYYQWKPTTGVIWNSFSVWPDTEAGQAAYARDLVAELKKHDNVNGLYWWFAEENGNGNWPDNIVIKEWVNRGLWNNSSHRALPALYELKEFVNRPGSDIGGITYRVPDGRWYTLSGMLLDTPPQRPGLYIHDGQKVIK